MNKELTPQDKLRLLRFGKVDKQYLENQYYDEIEKALEEYEKLEFTQNTINDFYVDTISMIEDLLTLFATKIIDSLKEGETYTKDRLLEILGFAHRYVMTFAKGMNFNENKETKKQTSKELIFTIKCLCKQCNNKKIKQDLLKIEKELKALEIIKYKASIDVLEELNEDEPYWLDIVCSTELTKEEYELLNEVLL